MRRIVRVIAAVLALSMLGSAPLFTEDQSAALRDFFASAENVRSFGAHPVNDLLRDPNNATFLKGFANKLLALRVYNEILDGDAKAARKLLVEKAGDVVIEKVVERTSPALGRALGWFGWVKTGLELTKKFVYDPAIQDFNLNLYADCREKGAEPADAAICIRSYGDIRLAALEEFKKEYSEKLIMKNGLLLPRWENRLNRFLTAWFEDQYQLRLTEQLRQKARAERDQLRGDINADQNTIADLLKTQKPAPRVATVPAPKPGEPALELYKIEVDRHGNGPPQWEWDAEGGTAKFMNPYQCLSGEFKWNVPRRIGKEGAPITITGGGTYLKCGNIAPDIAVFGPFKFTPDPLRVAGFMVDANNKSQSETKTSVAVPQQFGEDVVLDVGVYWALTFHYHYRAVKVR